MSGAEAGAVLDGLEARAREIIDQDASWQQDIPSMQKLEWAASVLAAHELLMDQLDDEARSLEILDRTMQRSWNTAWNRFLARRVASSVRRNGKEIRKVMNGLLSHYGPGWRWKLRRSEDAPEAVIVWVTHCFYKSFMDSHGHP